MGYSCANQSNQSINATICNNIDSIVHIIYIIVYIRVFNVSGHGSTPILNSFQQTIYNNLVGLATKLVS